MNEARAYTALWTARQCQRIKRAGVLGSPLAITFGGPHVSAPRFTRAGVRPGDSVFPINVASGRLRVLGRLHVGEIVSVEEYVSRHREWFEPIVRDHPEYRRLARFLETDRLRAFWQLRLWLPDHPEIDALCPGEADEVVLAADATPVRLDVTVPGTTVLQLRWESRRHSARPIRHLDANGHITHVISLQGIYRLTPASANLLDQVVDPSR